MARISKDSQQEQLIGKLLRVVAIASNHPDLFYDRNHAGDYSIFETEYNSDGVPYYAQPFGLGSRSPDATEQYIRGIIAGMEIFNAESVRMAWKEVNKE